jgi:hypothetical protein
MIKNIVDLLQEYNKTTGDLDIDLAIGTHELPITFKEAKRLIKTRYGK